MSPKVIIESSKIIFVEFQSLPKTFRITVSVSWQKKQEKCFYNFWSKMEIEAQSH